MAPAVSQGPSGCKRRGRSAAAAQGLTAGTNSSKLEKKLEAFQLASNPPQPSHRCAPDTAGEEVADHTNGVAYNAGAGACSTSLWDLIIASRGALKRQKQLLADWCEPWNPSQIELVKRHQGCTTCTLPMYPNICALAKRLTPAQAMGPAPSSSQESNARSPMPSLRVPRCTRSRWKHAPCSYRGVTAATTGAAAAAMRMAASSGCGANMVIKTCQVLQQASGCHLPREPHHCCEHRTPSAPPPPPAT